jgi:hypothetical protein
MIRNEHAHPLYTTNFMATLFAGAGEDLFDVRQAILGHLQQGGNPTPFDRILAMRFAAAGIERLIFQAEQQTPAWEFVGFHAGQLTFHNLEDLPRLMDATTNDRKEQWWPDVRPIAKVLAHPDRERGPGNYRRRRWDDYDKYRRQKQALKCWQSIGSSLAIVTQWPNLAQRLARLVTIGRPLPLSQICCRWRAGTCWGCSNLDGSWTLHCGN